MKTFRIVSSLVCVGFGYAFLEENRLLFQEMLTNTERTNI